MNIQSSQSEHTSMMYKQAVKEAGEVWSAVPAHKEPGVPWCSYITQENSSYQAFKVQCLSANFNRVILNVLPVRFMELSCF